MKSILLVLTLLLGTGLNGAAPTRVTSSSTTKAAYLKAEKDQAVTKPRVTFSLKKQRGRIVIPTTTGK